jgi:NAD(P)-dependent dehydrogenase (short-subunit alcohol dehydrogenase family)
MRKLDGKFAVVTGASRGIGKAVAEAYREEGATVLSASRSEGCDVSREEDVTRLFAGLSRLDILVNNAGILTLRKPMVEVTTREWDESMAVNLRAVFLCTRAALRLMIPQRRGLIIHLSSGAGKRAAPEWGPYAVAKWGVEGFTKTVAEEIKEFGIRVVAVNPGGTRTAMRAQAYPGEDPMTLKTPEKLAEFFVALAAGEVKFQTGDSLDYEGIHR